MIFFPTNPNPFGILPRSGPCVSATAPASSGVGASSEVHGFWNSPRRLQDEPRGRQDVSKMPSFFSSYFQSAFDRSWLDFPCQLGSTWFPKSIKIHDKSMPRGLPKLSSFLNGFLMDSYCQLQPPEPSKSLFFLRKNNCFFFSKKSSFEVGIDF